VRKRCLGGRFLANNRRKALGSSPARMNQGDPNPKRRVNHLTRSTWQKFLRIYSLLRHGSKITFSRVIIVTRLLLSFPINRKENIYESVTWFETFRYSTQNRQVPSRRLWPMRSLQSCSWPQSIINYQYPMYWIYHKTYSVHPFVQLVSYKLVMLCII
jgi:hypothetical protein